MNRTESADKSLLRQLFGQPAVVNHVVNETYDGPRVPLKNQTKGFGVTLAYASDKVC
jgi:hypothetical protein